MITGWLLLSLPGFGQKLLFTNLPDDSRLQNNNVYCIHEDYYGYLWIGTENGLHRYNGIKFTLFEHNPNDSATISGNVIFTMIEDHKNNLYFCTNNGLSKFDRANNRFISIPALLKDTSGILRNNTNYYVPQAIINSTNDLIASLGENGVFRLDTTDMILKRVDWLSDNPVSPIGVVTSTYEDNEYLWFGSQRHGLFRINLAKQQMINYNDTSIKYRIGANNIYAIYKDNANRLWVGSENGLFKLNPQTAKFELINLKPPTGFDQKVIIYTISGDNKGNVWFGSDGCGLYQLDPDNNLTNFTNDFFDKTSLASNFIRAIYRDRQDNIWLGTREGGLSYVLNNNAREFINFREKNSRFEGLSFRSVSTICKSGQPDVYYIGTDGGGIDELNLKTNQISKIEAISSKSVLNILYDNHAIWYGGYLEGLNNYNLRTKKKVTYRHNESDPESLGHNDVRFILKDHQDVYWIATNGGGLNRFDAKKATFQRFENNGNSQNRIISNYCITLYEDSKHNLWIGTYNGLSILDPSRKRFRNYYNVKNQNSLSSNWVYCFHEDQKGRMWIGTNFGLNLFDPVNEKFTVYLKENGLPGNEIMGIAEDATGNIWISTNNGICQFDANLKQFNIFDIYDGIVSNQFNHGAYLNDNNQLILFGSSYGLTIFDPSKIHINTLKPPVYITNFTTTNRTFAFNVHHKTDGYVVYPKKVLSFSEASVITFDFDALNYINARKNQFRYYLDGFDKEWHLAENGISATYNNLKPGKYTFRVIASNNNNVWNDKGATIEFTIKPPLYRTVWAKILYYIVTLSLIYFLWVFTITRERYKRDIAFEHLKSEKAEELARMKTEFFVNVSHELSTPLSLILVPLQRMYETARFDQQLTKTALNNAQRLLKLVTEILDFQKADDGRMTLSLTDNDLVLFVEGIVVNFKDLANEKQLTLEFEANEITTHMVRFDTEKMEKIMYNLVSNAIKYTPPGGLIKVELSQKPSSGAAQPQVEIKVTDNGIGIAHDKLEHIFEKYYRAQSSDKKQEKLSSTGYGIGLYLTKALVELHNGQIFVESTEGKGSVFSVVLPVIEALQHHAPDMPDAAKPMDLHGDEYNQQVDEILEEKENKPGKPLILIVEDNFELRMILKSILDQDYRILEAADGQQGLKMANRYLPDLVITDIMMPYFNGIEVCEKLKSDFYTCHIPVIMLTALNSNDHRIKGFEVGADDYISKPFNSKILEIRVKNLVESRQNLHRKFVTDLKVKPSEITVTSPDEEFLEKAIQMVETNIENPEFSVSELASLMNMSDATLYRKVKALTSQSPNIFIRTIRLKRAAQLLKTTRYSITQVVDMVGLNDVKYFRKCFQKQFGQNPLEFAQNGQQNDDF